jgi:hypothetical protein
VFPFVEQYRTPASIEQRAGRMSETTSVAISSDFSSVPLSQLTIADIVKTLFRGGAILFADKSALQSLGRRGRSGCWGGLGRLIIAACVLGGIALSVWGQR